MIKVFISLPMHSRSREAVLEEADKWFSLYKKCNFVKDEDAILVSPVDESFEPLRPEPKNTRLGYLARSLSILADADVCVLAPGFYTANGCLVELFACLCYGVKIIRIDPTIMDSLIMDKIASVVYDGLR